MAKTAIQVKRVKLQVKFPAEKKHPECRHWWPAIQLLMDIHKQAVKNKLASRIWKTKLKNKSNEGFVYTPAYIKLTLILFTQTSFYFGFDR